jgi:hypothetical protein
MGFPVIDCVLATFALMPWSRPGFVTGGTGGQ